MKEAKKITAGIDVNIENSTTLYHTIQGFINTKQCESEANHAFKLFFDNVYETMDLAGG